MFFKKIDWILILVIFLIFSLGLFSVYSASQSPQGLKINFQKQLFFGLIGFFLILAIGFFDYRFFKNFSQPIVILYIFTLFLLVAVLFFGTSIRGSKSWFYFASPFGGFAFAPAEFAKLVLILLLSKYFSQRHIEIYRFQHLIISGIYAFIFGILILRQPDFGAFLIISIIWLTIVMAAGIKWRHFFILILIGILLFFVSWFYFLKTYQKERILTFIYLQQKTQQAGYQSRQALIAIGQGGFLGKGIGRGSQTQLGFLPEATTDFLFASFVEERGLVGAFILFGLFTLFFWRIFKIAAAASNNFARLFCLGFSFLIFSQIIINAGMNMDLLPIVGIAFPFFSFGGSHLITSFIGLGLIQSIKVHN